MVNETNGTKPIQNLLKMFMMILDAVSKLGKMYSHSASWNGSKISLKKVAIVLAVIAIIYFVVKLSKNKDGTDGKEECQKECHDDDHKGNEGFKGHN